MYIAQLNAPYSSTFETVAEVSVLVFGLYNWLRFDNYLKQHIHKFAHMQHGYVYLYQYMYDVQKFFVLQYIFSKLLLSVVSWLPLV